MKLTENDIKRFWSKVDKSGDCWEWTAGKRSGYGHFWASGKSHYAHRIAWMLTHRYCDNIPLVMCVLHACDNRSCVNPRHLFLGTLMDNMQDMINKGRANKSKGEDHGRSKLTEKQVLEIRSKYIPRKYSMGKLAKEYIVTQPVIFQIIHREIWAHI